MMDIAIFKGFFTNKIDVEKSDEAEENLRSAGLMLFLAFIAGIFGGLGSIAFKAIIGFVRNLSFYGTIDFNLNPDEYIRPSAWGALFILVPVVASFLVTWITKTFAPEARGHGVPEVLNSIYYKKGKIRPSIVLAKAIASAISIGTGGSVGREGPIVQIGSAFGSMLGQIVKMPTRQRITLIAAGAAAGIAATFNAPIGGLAFAMELLLVSISARTVVLVSIATVTATYIGRIYNGVLPSFNVPKIAMFEDHYIGLYSLLFCIPLGIIVGVAAATFIRSIYKSEDLFNEKIKNDYVRHAIGMLGVGCILYMYLSYTGRYYVGGVGYATIIDTLKGIINDPYFLAILFFSKLLMTSITLGSGASGGVFAPSLFLGATLGASFGNLVSLVFPALGGNAVIYTVAGMAAMVGGTTGTVITAIIMTFEQTRDYGAILPIILTVSIAHLVRVSICTESIYTLKLARRGNYVPQGLKAATTIGLIAKKIMSKNFEIINIEKIEEWRSNYVPNKDRHYTLVARNEVVIGMAREDLLYMLQDKKVEDIIDENVGLVMEKTKWPVIMRTMKLRDTETVIVTKQSASRRISDIVGVISAKEFIAAEENEADLID